MPGNARTSRSTSASLHALEHVFMWYWYHDRLPNATGPALERRGSLHWSSAYVVMPAKGGQLRPKPAPEGTRKRGIRAHLYPTSSRQTDSGGPKVPYPPCPDRRTGDINTSKTPQAPYQLSTPRTPEWPPT